MPAAIAVPLAGAAIGAVGNAISAHSAQSAHAKQLAAANAASQQQANEYAGWQQGLSNPSSVAGGLFSQLTGPQTSTSTGAGTSSMQGGGTHEETQQRFLTPEFADVPAQARAALGEVAPSLAGMLQQQYGQIAGQERATNAALQNRAAMTGASPQDVALATAIGPGAQQAQAARLAAMQGVQQTGYERTQAARQNLANIAMALAANKTQGSNTQWQRGATTSNQTNVGPGNFGAALSLLQPQQRQIFV